MESLQERVQRVLKEEVAIVPYDTRWPGRFRQEEQHLRTVLPQELVGGIEHYGGTAVAGLPAKPIVDMLIEVSAPITVLALSPPVSFHLLRN